MTENEIQRAVFSHLKTRAAPGVFAFHPKNGGIHQRGRASGINTGLGVIPGVPDVILIRHGRVSALELKTVKGGRSDEQINTQARMEAAGCEVDTAYGLDAAIAWLEQRGFLRGRAA